MKPPPGPMFSFSTAARSRPTRLAPPPPISSVGGHGMRDRGPRVTAAAVGLALALTLGGAAVLAPYAGPPTPDVTVTAPGP